MEREVGCSGCTERIIRNGIPIVSGITQSLLAGEDANWYALGIGASNWAVQSLNHYINIGSRKEYWGTVLSSQLIQYGIAFTVSGKAAGDEVMMGVGIAATLAGFVALNKREI